ncbi:hypothetical protein [Thermasporomyces composti]|uniref:Uncharacterized protein n=1 Tax=Thermasporomyces composti TaxID=696763 RepID=A0A3D9V5W7_THECX|nr:hypothetical protein [Thermasporomyces composti]REF37158.1 hypothetical protein DFJ64_2596 [Thermasporomyces composti]
MDRFVSGLALVFLVVVGLFVLAIKAEQAVEKRPTESYEKCVDDDWSEDVWGEDDWASDDLLTEDSCDEPWN